MLAVPRAHRPVGRGPGCHRRGGVDQVGGAQLPERQPEYGRLLADAGFWTPVVHDVLARHDLPRLALEVPFRGSFPTFVVGEVVVKVLGPAYEGPAAHEREVACLEAVRGVVPAPALVASGDVGPPSWRYLVMSLVEGPTCVEELCTSEVAADLGRCVRALHGIEPPPAVPALADRWAEAGGGRRVLVHADLTPEHVFHRDGRVTAIIDWGDAMVTEPVYELAALFAGCLGFDLGLLDAFLDGYGWGQLDEARFAIALRTHEFDLFPTL